MTAWQLSPCEHSSLLPFDDLPQLRHEIGIIFTWMVKYSPDIAIVCGIISTTIPFESKEVIFKLLPANGSGWSFHEERGPCVFPLALTIVWI